MRRGVMAPNLFAPFRIDGRVHGVAGAEFSGNQPPVMRDRVARVLRVGHFEDGIAARDATVVADLTALLGVERRAVEHYPRFGAGLDLLGGPARRQDGEDRSVGLESPRSEE